MLLEFDTASEMNAGQHPAEPEDPSDPVSLLDRVQKAFPALVIRSSWLDRSGGDHLVVVVNDEHAFRFPREGVHNLGLEIEVLRHLRPRTQVAIPEYEHVDPAGRFAGYRFIKGEALTRAKFALIDESAITEVLHSTAAFLSVLHDLPQADVAWPDTWPKAWTTAQYADRGLFERMPLIVRHAPHLAGPLEAFYGAYRHDRADRLAIIHGDLVCEHILIDRARSALAGIIDFGDVALGDPAQDLLGFWSYGPDAAARVVARYDPRGNDPDLLRRSRNHFIRYRIDDLFERLDRGRLADAPAQMAAVAALLTPSTPYDL